MAVAFLGNKSYTGEESVELYFHGGKYLTEQALLCILDAGARMAEAAPRPCGVAIAAITSFSLFVIAFFL